MKSVFLVLGSWFVVLGSLFVRSSFLVLRSSLFVCGSLFVVRCGWFFVRCCSCLLFVLVVRWRLRGLVELPPAPRDLPSALDGLAAKPRDSRRGEKNGPFGGGQRVRRRRDVVVEQKTERTERD